jgi:thiol-disulfide isomerase/thioredoxin
MFNFQKRILLFSLSMLSTTSFISAEEAVPQLAAPDAPATPLMADKIVENMTPHLINTAGEKVKIDLKEKDYVLIYWSASWCGPCQQFTPELVDFYNKNEGGKKFEVVLMCLDHTAEKMASYTKAKKMPWPAVSFDEKANTGAKDFVKKNIKGGIPRLMIINKKGEVLGAGNAPFILTKFKEILAKAP